MPHKKREEIELLVKEVIAKELGVPLEKITFESKLVEDLWMDSFSAIELFFILEDRLKIKIADDDIRNLISVGDVVDYI